MKSKLSDIFVAVILKTLRFVITSTQGTALGKEVMTGLGGRNTNVKYLRELADDQGMHLLVKKSTLEVEYGRMTGTWKSFQREEAPVVRQKPGLIPGQEERPHLVRVGKRKRLEQGVTPLVHPLIHPPEHPAPHPTRAEVEAEVKVEPPEAAWGAVAVGHVHLHIHPPQGDDEAIIINLAYVLCL